MGLTSRRSTLLFGAALGVGSLLLTACGSTAARTSATTQAEGLSTGLTAAGAPAGGGVADQAVAASPGAAAASGDAFRVGGGGTGSQRSTTTTTAGGAGGSQGGPVGGPGAPQAAVGPGVTATTILLGIPYCSDCAAGNAALGVTGTDNGDPRGFYKALLNEVNSRGGVLGRKLVPLFHNISAADNFDVSSQEVCSTFTEDNKVFAMFMRGEIAATCARKAGILNIGPLGAGPSYARYRNVFFPRAIATERLSAITVRGMVKAGWQKPTPKWPTGKIGIITWDNPDYRYGVSHGTLPALRAAGLTATDVRYVAVPQSSQSVADASAAVSAAVLSFRDKGIDHVFISDGSAGIFAGAGLTFTFLNTAQSQRYFPRYGFNTNNVPGWSQLPAEQQSGMLAVDATDGSDDADEGLTKNPQRLRCIKAIEKAGLKAAGGDAVLACEYAWFIEAVLKRAQSTLLPNVIEAAESLGTSYRSPVSFGNRLSRTQHDGESLFRNSRFDDDCACMKYTSKPYEP